MDLKELGPTGRMLLFDLHCQLVGKGSRCDSKENPCIIFNSPIRPSGLCGQRTHLPFPHLTSLA